MPKKTKGKKNPDDDWNDNDSKEAEEKLSAQMEDLATTSDTVNGDKKKKKKVIK